MRTKILVAAVAAFVVSASSVLAQTVLFSDNFDSYADQTALDAVWPTSGTAMTLDTAQAHSGTQSIYQGTVAQQSYHYLGQEVAVPDVDFSFWFYDPAGDTSLARTYGMLYARAGAGDWAGGLQQIVAIGKYNGIATTKYSARIAFGGPNWFNLDLGPDRSVGWHEAEVVGSLVGGSAQYDFYIDNILSGTGTSTVTSTFDWIVMGSGLSSSHGMWYDDVVMTVPEPTTLGLSLLGGLGMLWVLRRRTV